MSNKLIISVFAFIFSIHVYGQKSDSTNQKKDFLPTGVRIGMDLGSLARSFYSDTFSGAMFSADVDFYRYILNVEFGSWQRNLSSDQDFYDNNGSFLRVGVDVNFLLNDPDRNVLFLGLRYATSSFDENLSVVVEDPLWGGSKTYSNDGVTGRWLEGTFGLRVKMWKWIWMGYTARYKFGLKLSDTPDMIPHDIPGYGTNSEKAVWGFNYQIFLRIPFGD